MEGREPDLKIWGGAQRGAGKFAPWNFGMTGLPELGDDLTTTFSMVDAKVIGARDVRIRTSSKTPMMPQALEFIGATEASYSQMGTEICRIVESAAELTFS